MTAQISAYGRLVADPQTRTTTTEQHGNGAAGGGASLQCGRGGRVNLLAGRYCFGKQADALAKHQKGDLVSVAGNMQVNQWTGQDGGTQQGYQVVADSVISARTVRPGGKAGQQGQATDALRRAQQPSRDEYDQRPPFDDEAPF
jgi:single-stranded DNA-binding protein